jgi:hypothetical protein
VQVSLRVISFLSVSIIHDSLDLISFSCVFVSLLTVRTLSINRARIANTTEATSIRRAYYICWFFDWRSSLRSAWEEAGTQSFGPKCVVLSISIDEGA